MQCIDNVYVNVKFEWISCEKCCEQNDDGVEYVLLFFFCDSLYTHLRVSRNSDGQSVARAVFSVVLEQHTWDVVVVVVIHAAHKHTQSAAAIAHSAHNHTHSATPQQQQR